MTRWRAGLLLASWAALAPGAPAQGYRLRLDTRVQGVSYRGVILDSIPAADTVGTPGGGPTSPDGYAVRCSTASAYCTYFRAGPVRRGGPLTTVADLSVWGVGVSGLSAHASARLGVDLGRAEVWPGTSPAVHLLEGYAQYAVPRFTARAGRQGLSSRLGTTAFDGARLVVRDGALGLELGGFAGWALERGAALPVTSPALNPLDDFQPRRRQIVAGIGAGWNGARLDLRADYLREVDPRSDHFVSERVGLVAVWRPGAQWSVSGGADYDLAAGWWGSAEGTVAFTTRLANAAVGLRRYRPHFELWTIWGAFSPVPYQAAHARVALRVGSQLQLRARGERYTFDAAEVSTPLVGAEREGWRWEVGSTVTPADRWTFDFGYHREFGSGAASAGTGGSIAYEAGRALRVTLHGATLDRPLEFRFSDAAVRVYGLDAQGEVSRTVRLSLGASRYVEKRARPDAAAFDWGQWRITARMVVELGRGADLRGLPRAMRRLPGGRAAR